MEIAARKCVDILGVKVDRVRMEQALTRIDLWVRELAKVYVCAAPVSTVVSAYEDPDYRAVVNGAGMVLPDGVPVVWSARRKGVKDIARVCGPDLMRKICLKSDGRPYRHFFYGAAPETLEKLCGNLERANPQIVIAGRISPEFHETAVPESQDVVDRINAAKPDILWVGLGSPKQDVWMAMHRARLEVPVMIGVGAAFDFLAGHKRRAPRWMQNAGLEWLFRLWTEPCRLGRRYIIGNSKFIFYALRHSCLN
ncbi:MAG: WecB/TagA/CpsF family glycosyltransferase [Candidatus Omnitrophota bacterium]